MSLTCLKYLWGDEVLSPILPKFQEISEFRKMNLMLSAWDFTKLGKNYEKLRTSGMRQFLGLNSDDNRQLIIDSGGFKGYTRNIVLDPQIVLKIYDASDLKPHDKVIVLDRAPLPNEESATRLAKIRETIQNYHLMREQSKRVLQVVHGWNRKEMELSLSSCIDESFITFPSYFTLLTNNRKDTDNNRIIIKPHCDLFNCECTKQFFAKTLQDKSPKIEKMTLQRMIIKRIVDFIQLYQHHNLSSRVHTLGASAGLAMHILFYTGVFSQMDSANWRVKSNHSKIMLAYPDFSLAEGYTGNQTIHYGSTKWKEEWNPYLMRCECPVCKGLSLIERKEILGKTKSEGFINRAVHNAYHYYQELTIAKELKGTAKYFDYIENRVNDSSPFYQMLWKAIKRSIIPHNQQNLDAFLKHEQDRPQNIYQ